MSIKHINKIKVALGQRDDLHLSASHTPVNPAKSSTIQAKEKVAPLSEIGTPVKNSVCANANLKRKSALGELGEALEMIVEKQKKRREKRDIEMETTRRLAEKNLRARQQSKLAWEREQKLAELEDKKAERAFFLKMKRMELLKDGISVLHFKKQKGNVYKSGMSNSFFLMKKIINI